ncbi:MAG: hypothetical protein P857_68 [Candidatus Xenolissoclinum pacificiensis L6]|uniref:Cell division protein ZapA n=1 Tax=Candidatus Xenolissoclinum pacificiensis L6 TaxID=1401685 RepID=W2V217_9RICK|nr:MAG: hypothetical protein P857_68 [Candidatus Xenolissoclinum pacificiensis L6]
MFEHKIEIKGQKFKIPKGLFSDGEKIVESINQKAQYIEDVYSHFNFSTDTLMIIIIMTLEEELIKMKEDYISRESFEEMEQYLQKRLDRISAMLEPAE